VIFERLGTPREGDWSLASAVTFYEAPVIMVQCQFTDIRSDAAISVIRSDFVIKRSLFRNGTGAAVMSSFSGGTVENTGMEDLGGDGIQVVGGKVLVKKVVVKGVGKTGIAVRMHGEVRIEQSAIRGCSTGIECTDGGDVMMDGGEIAHCENGITVYQGPDGIASSAASMTDVHIEKVRNRYRLEEGSRFVVNGETMKSNIDPFGG